MLKFLCIFIILTTQVSGQVVAVTVALAVAALADITNDDNDDE